MLLGALTADDQVKIDHALEGGPRAVCVNFGPLVAALEARGITGTNDAFPGERIVATGMARGRLCALAQSEAGRLRFYWVPLDAAHLRAVDIDEVDDEPAREDDDDDEGEAP